MSRLSRHLGIGEKLIIDGQEYNIKPLSIKELPLLFQLGKHLSIVKDKGGDDAEELLKHLPPEGVQILVDIMLHTLRNSFPDETEDVISQFGMKYMKEIFPLIMSLNTVEKSDDMKRRDAMLEHIKTKNDSA